MKDKIQIMILLYALNKTLDYIRITNQTKRMLTKLYKIKKCNQSKKTKKYFHN